MCDQGTTDELLAVRCQLGDSKAWELLVVRWHPKLWRFISRMLCDRHITEDTLQTAWLRIIRSMGGLREPKRLPAWLYSIARAAVVDQLRGKYKEKLTEQYDDFSESEESIATLHALDNFETALTALHPIDREALVLHYIEDLSVADVANVCGVPVGTVKSRLHRARQTLRNALLN